MNENTVAIFTDGSCTGNPGPTGAGAFIFKNGLNKPAIKLARAVPNNSTNYHAEVEAPLGLKYIKPLSTPWSSNNVHIFSDSIAAINAIISPTQQDLRSNLIEEMKYISKSIEPVTIFATHLSAHSGIAHNKEADRLAKIGANYMTTKA